MFKLPVSIGNNVFKLPVSIGNHLDLNQIQIITKDIQNKTFFFFSFFLFCVDKFAFSLIGYVENSVKRQDVAPVGWATD